LEVVKSYYFSELKKNTSESVCLLHTQFLSQNDLLEIISSYVMEKYNQPNLSTKIYVRRFLPNATIANDEMLAAETITNQQRGNMIEDPV
jgi:hypothetical protein